MDFVLCVRSSSGHGGQPARPFGTPQPESAKHCEACMAGCNVSPRRCCWLRSALAGIRHAGPSIEPLQSQGRRLIELPVLESELSCQTLQSTDKWAPANLRPGVVETSTCISVCASGLAHHRHRLSRGMRTTLPSPGPQRVRFEHATAPVVGDSRHGRKAPWPSMSDVLHAEQSR